MGSRDLHDSVGRSRHRRDRLPFRDPALRLRACRSRSTLAVSSRAGRRERFEHLTGGGGCRALPHAPFGARLDRTGSTYEAWVCAGLTVCRRLASCRARRTACGQFATARSGVSSASAPPSTDARLASRRRSRVGRAVRVSGSYINRTRSPSVPAPTRSVVSAASPPLSGVIVGPSSRVIAHLRASHQSFTSISRSRPGRLGSTLMLMWLVIPGRRGQPSGSRTRPVKNWSNEQSPARLAEP